MTQPARAAQNAGVASAHEALETGDYGGAMQLAQELLKHEPGNVDAFVIIAELALEAGNRDLANRVLGNARRASPADPRIAQLAASAAQQTWQRRLPDRLAATARKALAANAPDRALALAQAAVKSDPGLAVGHEIMGRAFLRAGRPAEAAVAFAEAQRRMPGNPELKALLEEATKQVVPSDQGEPSHGADVAAAGNPENGIPMAGPARNLGELALAPIVPKHVTRRAVGRKICITFGGEVYDGPTALTVMLAPKFGADEVWVYDDHWLMTQRRDFYEQNRWLWEHHHKRGFGWYAWKPFILLDAMERMSDGDVVMYIDADTFPVDDFSVLYETCASDGGIMLFKAGGNVNNRFKQSQWCKRDCFIAMNQDSPVYHNAEAGVARFMLFQKGPWRARQFLMEWLTYCVNPIATTFDPSVLGQPELPGFVEHRTEQAIMTNLAHKYGLKLYREACELGNSFPEDKELYPQLFSQVNPWGNKTAPCAGSRFRNVT